MSNVRDVECIIEGIVVHEFRLMLYNKAPARYPLDQIYACKAVPLFLLLATGIFETSFRGVLYSPME